MNQAGYAGVKTMSFHTFLFHALGSAEFLNWRGTLHQIILSATDIKGMSLPAMLAGIFLLSALLQKEEKISTYSLKSILDSKYIKLILVAALLYVPQYLLYLRNTLHDRYNLPAAVTFSLIIIFCYHQLSTKRSKIVLLLLAIIFTTQTVAFTLTEAVSSAKKGREITSCLTAIDKALTTQKERKVLLVFKNVHLFFDPALFPNETILTISRYLRLKYGDNVDIALLPVSPEVSGKFSSKVLLCEKLYHQDNIHIITPEMLPSYKVLYVDKWVTRHFFGLDGKSILLSSSEYKSLEANSAGLILKQKK